MSHGAWFRKRSDLVEAIEAAMDEAMDQGASLALPTLREGNPVPLQQARLLTVAERRSDASVPLLDSGLPVGVLTLDSGHYAAARAATEPIRAETQEYCAH